MDDKLRIGVTGNFDSKIRGDCKVQIKLLHSGGIALDLHSKVKAFFSKSITDLVMDMTDYFSIKHAKVTIWDSGALKYVIAARIEASIKQIIVTDKEFLFKPIDECAEISKRDRFRFSRLYLPGNTPYLMINAGLHKPNGLILDLEDAVSPVKKEEARYIVRNTLRSQKFYGAERMVRINQGELGLVDLEFIVAHCVQLILIPKCETVDDIQQIDQKINQIKKDKSIDREIYLMPIIESALGIENAFAIANSSENIVAMAIGLEDFTADIGVQRTINAQESLYARMRIVNACHAAKIQPIDSVFSDVGDMDSLAKNVITSKSIGFQGMGCIHPRQIRVIHENFAPDELEIEKAMKIVSAFYKAQEKGMNVVALGNKMIDPPVVKRQLKLLDLAIGLEIVNANWRESYDC